MRKKIGRILPCCRNEYKYTLVPTSDEDNNEHRKQKHYACEATKYIPSPIISLFIFITFIIYPFLKRPAATTAGRELIPVDQRDLLSTEAAPSDSLELFEDQRCKFSACQSQCRSVLTEVSPPRSKGRPCKEGIPGRTKRTCTDGACVNRLCFKDSSFNWVNGAYDLYASDENNLMYRRSMTDPSYWVIKRCKQQNATNWACVWTMEVRYTESVPDGSGTSFQESNIGGHGCIFRKTVRGGAEVREKPLAALKDTTWEACELGIGLWPPHLEPERKCTYTEPCMEENTLYKKYQLVRLLQEKIPWEWDCRDACRDNSQCTHWDFIDHRCRLLKNASGSYNMEKGHSGTERCSMFPDEPILPDANMLRAPFTNSIGSDYLLDPGKILYEYSNHVPFPFSSKRRIAICVTGQTSRFRLHQFIYRFLIRSNPDWDIGIFVDLTNSSSFYKEMYEGAEKKTLSVKELTDFLEELPQVHNIVVRSKPVLLVPKIVHNPDAFLYSDHEDETRKRNQIQPFYTRWRLQETLLREESLNSFKYDYVMIFREDAAISNPIIFDNFLGNNTLWTKGCRLWQGFNDKVFVMNRNVFPFFAKTLDVFYTENHVIQSCWDTEECLKLHLERTPVTLKTGTVEMLPTCDADLRNGTVCFKDYYCEYKCSVQYSKQVEKIPMCGYMGRPFEELDAAWQRQDFDEKKRKRRRKRVRRKRRVPLKGTSAKDSASWKEKMASMGEPQRKAYMEFMQKLPKVEEASMTLPNLHSVERKAGAMKAFPQKKTLPGVLAPGMLAPGKNEPPPRVPGNRKEGNMQTPLISSRLEKRRAFHA